LLRAHICRITAQKVSCNVVDWTFVRAVAIRRDIAAARETVC